MTRSQPDGRKPIVKLELKISLSGDPAILKRLAKGDRRMELSRRGCNLALDTETPAAAIAELRAFVERVRKAANSERV